MVDVDEAERLKSQGGSRDAKRGIRLADLLRGRIGIRIRQLCRLDKGNDIERSLLKSGRTLEGNQVSLMLWQK